MPLEKMAVWALCEGVLCESLLDEYSEVSGEAVHGEAHHVEVAAHTSKAYTNSVSKWVLPEARGRCHYNCPKSNSPFRAFIPFFSSAYGLCVVCD